jgi:DNA-binding Lrp family transcriptional regulator
LAANGTADMRRKLDQIDLNILRELQQDGRITNQDLSERVGLSPRPCLERVRRLERDRVVTGYRALVDVRQVRSTVTVIAQIALEKQSRHTQTLFERRLQAIPEVVDCYEVSGSFDYVARIICGDIDGYQDLTASWLEDPEMGIARIVSNVVLRPVRENGPLPLEGRES